MSYPRDYSPTHSELSDYSLNDSLANLLGVPAKNIVGRYQPPDEEVADDTGLVFRAIVHKPVIVLGDEDEDEEDDDDEEDEDDGDFISDPKPAASKRARPGSPSPDEDDEEEEEDDDESPSVPAVSDEPASKVARLESKAPPFEIIPECIVVEIALKVLRLPDAENRHVTLTRSPTDYDFAIHRGSRIARILNDEDRAVASFDNHVALAVVEMTFPVGNFVLVRIYRPGINVVTWVRTPYCRLLHCRDIIDTIRPDTTFGLLASQCKKSNRKFGVVVTPGNQGLSVPTPFVCGDTVAIKPRDSSAALCYGRVLASFTDARGVNRYVLRWFTEAPGHPSTLQLSDEVGDAPADRAVRKIPGFFNAFVPADFK